MKTIENVFEDLSSLETRRSELLAEEADLWRSPARLLREFVKEEATAHAPLLGIN